MSSVEEESDYDEVMEMLKENGIPTETLDKLMREKNKGMDPSAAKRGRKSFTPEILDVDTLLELEENKDKLGIQDFKDTKTLKRLQEQASNLICHRCHSLKHHQKLIDHKGSLPA